MTATRAQIRAALWGALSELLPGETVRGDDGMLYTTADVTAARPLRSLHRYAGEVSRFGEGGREKGVAHTTAGQFPAAFLAFEGSEPVGTNGAFVETFSPMIEVVRRTGWSVFVSVNDPSGDGAAEDAADVVCERIEGALAALHVDGLLNNAGLRWVRTVPWVISRRASYVYRLQFTADTALPASTPTENPVPGEPLAGVRGTVPDASPDSDAAEVALSSFNTLPDD